MGVFHSEEEKQRELAAFQAERQKRVNFGKKALLAVVIWDAIFAVLNGFAIPLNVFESVYTMVAFAMYFVIVFFLGCGLVALDLAVLLGGWSWARFVRGILAFIITVYGIWGFFGSVVNEYFIFIFSFIGNLAIGLFLFGSNSVQKYIEVKRKAH